MTKLYEIPGFTFEAVIAIRDEENKIKSQRFSLTFHHLAFSVCLISSQSRVVLGSE